MLSLGHSLLLFIPSHMAQNLAELYGDVENRCKASQKPDRTLKNCLLRLWLPVSC
jgi:hypothetical protein